MTKTIHVQPALSDEECAALAKKRAYIDNRHFDLIVSEEPTDVIKPDGSPLLLYRPGAIPRDACELAWPALRKIGSRFSLHREFNSGLTGNFDMPKCRSMEVTAADLERHVACLPFIRSCNAAFRTHLRSRYAPQRKAAAETDQRFVIPGTAFSTVTVNLWKEFTFDGRTYVHTDKGDLPEGFGVLSVLRGGRYTGGHLIFPRYRVAVDLSTTDLLLADVHEYHANAPIVGRGDWERIATIHYYRTAMRQKCPR